MSTAPAMAARRRHRKEQLLSELHNLPLGARYIMREGLRDPQKYGVAAIRPGDRLPPPPEVFPRVSGGLVPVWVEFQHRVGAPSEGRVRRRFLPGKRP